MPGYVDWTGEGQHFAWRMKIQYRQVHELKFAVMDFDKKVIHEIDPRKFLNQSQYQQMYLHPRMLVQFAEFAKEFGRKEYGITNSEVRCIAKVSFNGTEPAYIFNPQHDLVKSYAENKHFNDWLNPLPELN